MSTELTLQKAKSLTITSSEDMHAASELRSNIKQAIKEITEDKERLTKPINQALKDIRERYKPRETELNDALERINEEMSRYQTETARKAEEEAAKIASRIAPGKGNLTLGTAIKKLAEVERPEELALTKFRNKPVLKITDETKIPRHYLKVDEDKLFEDLKKGVTVYGAEIEIIQIPVNSR